MDLATRIRTELADGKPPEQIVTDLVASGMSQPTAQRLVDRALTTPAPPPPAATADDEATEDAGGKWALVRGAFFFSLGATLTAVTYLLAKPGQKYTVMYGAIIVGLVVFAQGFYRWAMAEHHTFPAMLVLAALGLPMLGGAGLYWYKREPTLGERLTRVLEETEAAEQAKREQDKVAKKRAVQKSVADAQEGAAAAYKMVDASPQVRCQGAQYFRDHKDPAAFGELTRLVETDPDMPVRRCAIDALVAIGSTKSLLRILDRLAQYEGFREVVVYGLDKITETPADSTREEIDRVRMKAFVR